MSNQTSSAALSTLDPTLLDGVRDRLAEAFAEQVYAVVPEVAEIVEIEADKQPRAEENARQRRAAEVLMAARGSLKARVASLTRSHFDRKREALAGRRSRSELRSLEDLALVAHDTLDEEITINHCGRRLKEQCQHELWGFTKRLCMLLGKGRISDQNHPAFPALFPRVLMDALTELETHTMVKLALFRCFGPALLDIASESYLAANEFLGARGLYVDAEEYYGAPIPAPERAPASVSAPASATAVKPAPAGAGLVAVLQRLMNQAQGRPAAEGAKVIAMSSARPAQPATPPSWSQQLKSLGRGLVEKGGADEGRALHQAREALRGQMDSDEQIVTDVVTVLFDKLRADARVQPALKDVVNRLQVPVLETALRDRAFFSEADHPARKLIDLIVELGLTVSAAEDTPLPSIAGVVDGLVRLHASGEDAFRQAYHQLDDLFYHHEEAALQGNAEVRRLENRESLADAQDRVDHEIALRMAGWRLPEVYQEFVQGAWREVMVRDYLREGSKGESLRLSLATLDELLRCLKPMPSPEERQHAIKVLPFLIKLFKDESVQAGYGFERIEDFLHSLQNLCARILRGEACTQEGVRFDPDAELPLTPIATGVSVSARMSQLGLTCGDWLESCEAGVSRRWRLNWVTPIRGTCVLKDHQSGEVQNPGLEELCERLARGQMVKVVGLGLTDDVLKEAMNTVARKLRRQQAAAHAAARAQRTVTYAPRLLASA